MNRRQIVPIEQVSPDQQDAVKNCFYCSCPKHPKKAKAVAVIAVEGINNYYGICGYHAEAYPLTEEQEQQHPMLCPHCFSREDL